MGEKKTVNDKELCLEWRYSSPTQKQRDFCKHPLALCVYTVHVQEGYPIMWDHLLPQFLLICRAVWNTEMGIQRRRKGEQVLEHTMLACKNLENCTRKTARSSWETYLMQTPVLLHDTWKRHHLYIAGLWISVASYFYIRPLRWLGFFLYKHQQNYESAVERWLTELDAMLISIPTAYVEKEYYLIILKYNTKEPGNSSQEV